jgi:RTC4-like domain
MDLRPEYTARIAGLSLQDFTLLVLIPAAIVRLIQDDENSRLGVNITFDQAWKIAKSTTKVGDSLFPDDDDEIPLNAEYIATKLAEREDEGGSST